MRKALERTYRRRVRRDQLVSPELARHLAEVSRQLSRQVGVLINREGVIKNVFVGDATELHLPDFGRFRGGLGRFRGLRYVHTHLRGEGLTDDDLNDLALLRFDAVAMIEVMGDGLPGRVEVALIEPFHDGDVAGDEVQEPFRRIKARDVHHLDIDFDFDAEIRAREAELARLRRGAAGETTRERAMLISVRPDDEHFEEMLELVGAAGVELVGAMRQKRFRIHPATVVGRGKLREIVLESMRLRAEVAIFDIDLKPAQARAFEDATALKAIDRTQLILDIFAQRAQSRDGKLQVELAQLRYSLPRLTDKDAGLSRLTGGIGGRGPGETVMEIGRRRVRDRIRALERQIDQLSRQREVRRKRRRDKNLPVLSIIGYTNAGKSTLLNALTQSKVDTADQLFMTLDPSSRRLRFPREGEVIITDTVGFISELPPDLVAAFRATLEELEEAALLLHVVDMADPRLEAKREAVQRILEELELAEIPRLVVLNKADLVEPELAGRLAEQYGGVAVSAVQRRGMEELVGAAEKALAGTKRLLETPAQG